MASLSCFFAEDRGLFLIHQDPADATLLTPRLHVGRQKGLGIFPLIFIHSIARIQNRKDY